MIRFVNLTEAYYGDPEDSLHICAFISTSGDKFLQTMDGTHTFDDLASIKEHPKAQRMLSLLPRGFFNE